MIKKTLIVLVTLIVVIVLIVVIYRYQIFQYSAESIIRNVLPSYVEVGTIRFEFVNHMLILGDFRILNPPDFSNKYLLDIKEIKCAYGMKGKSFLQGISIYNPAFTKPVLYIERLSDGRTNMTQMQVFIDENTPQAFKKKPAGVADGRSRNPLSKETLAATFLGDRKASDIIQLPEQFFIEHGKVIFIDRLNAARTHMLTLENIKGSMGIKMDDDYSSILRIVSTGSGDVNGKKGEILTWTSSLDPTTPKLTMSNRFELTSVEIKPFEPYYDKYSPLIFKTGKFSGMLVFDFDNGNIGSTNEIRLSNVQFYIKEGWENAQFWETNVPDLVRYFTSSRGDIIFDFKIKGEMSNPKFYLGPISKQALASYAIDKISATMQELSQQGPPGAAAPDSKVEKIKQYIDIFKEITNKK